MRHVLLHDEAFAVVRLAGHLLADLDGLRQLMQSFLQTLLAIFPHLYVQGLPREAQLCYAFGDATLRQRLASQDCLISFHALQRCKAPLRCLIDVLLNQHSRHGYRRRDSQVRDARHVVAPPLRGKELVETRRMWEACGDSRPFHCLHRAEERLLVHESCPVVLAGLHRGDAAFLKGGWVQKVHAADLLGSTHGVLSSKDLVSHVCHLGQVGWSLDVHSPNLKVVADLGDHCHVDEGL
mmetsp:Transcript_51630/g.83761  ORF Transcript_51630/g.83761 Transcript_51630/m.83761 type:complete len:238 (-) Transcript_51630:537-1250(-)